MTQTRDRSAAVDNVIVELYDPKTVVAQHPDWDRLSQKQKTTRLEDVEPDRTHSTHNVVCIGLHEYLVSNLNPEEDDNLNLTHLAFSESQDDPAIGDRDLTDEVFRTPISKFENLGRELRTTTSLDTGMANGLNLLTLGLVDSDDTEDYLLANHSTVPDPEGRLNPKTPSVIANIIVVLEKRDESEV